MLVGLLGTQSGKEIGVDGFRTSENENCHWASSGRYSGSNMGVQRVSHRVS